MEKEKQICQNITYLEKGTTYYFYSYSVYLFSKNVSKFPSDFSSHIPPSNYTVLPFPLSNTEITPLVNRTVFPPKC